MNATLSFMLARLLAAFGVLLAGCASVNDGFKANLGSALSGVPPPAAARLERCQQLLGTLAIAAPPLSGASGPAADVARQRAETSNALLSQMVEESGCFVLTQAPPSASNGGTSNAALGSLLGRALGAATGAAAGVVGGATSRRADFTLQPDVQVATSLSQGVVQGAAAAQLREPSGIRPFDTASARLQLLDNRSGIQLSSATGLAVAESSRSQPQHTGTARVGTEGALSQALIKSYNETVRAASAARAASELAAVQSRFVNLDAPRAVRPTQVIAVQVWLSQREQTAGVTVTPPSGRQLREDGSLPLDLPRNRSTWTIDVALTAPGFDFADGSSNQFSITLAQADSDIARFQLVPRVDVSGRQLLRAALWHRGQFLGSVSREIEVERPALRRSPGVPEAQSLAREAHVGVNGPTGDTIRFETTAVADAPVRGALAAPSPLTPDLTVTLHHDDPTRLDNAHVTLHSPHFVGAEFEPWQLPRGSDEWLARWMDRLQRNAGAVPAVDVPGRLALLRGMGRELYDRFAPPLLKRKLAEQPKLRTIQFHSNNLMVPWEMMRPGRVGARDYDFLGTDMLVARWPAEGRGSTRPPQKVDVREVVVVAPEYDGSERLAAQREEVDFIARLRGFRRSPATFDAMRQLALNPPRGIVHFAGHGELTGIEAIDRRYHLRLSDGRLDAIAWRGLPKAAAPPPSLFFFNACELGVTESQAGALAGWAPAVLDGGAGGYIGGLWSMRDTAASTFARQFYAELRSAEPGTARITVSETLRRARNSLFLATGDPTYLAYVFYGDVNLQLALP